MHLNDKPILRLSTQNQNLFPKEILIGRKLYLLKSVEKSTSSSLN